METERLVLKAFLEAHPDDAALILEGLTAAETAGLLHEIPAELAAALVQRMAPVHAADALAALPVETAGATISDLPLDSAAMLLRRMEPSVRGALLKGLPAGIADPLRLLLSYPEESAGALMDPQVLALPDDIPVSEALVRVRHAPQHALYYLYVIDRAHHLVGVLSLRELMLAPPQSLLSSVMHPHVARIASDADRLGIIAHPGWQRFHALPVVDQSGAFLGVIRYETLRLLEDHSGTTRRFQGPLGTFLSVGEFYWIGLSRLIVGLVSAMVPESSSDPGKDTPAPRSRHDR